ncbi:hypothetical protein VFPFJ_04590 [Purpureocillium lilacinum]|uniref:Uncharacterized protein n=1 Tax=Purpureocillium lilacinum TaxID=33203 RepID=A0A179HLT9_PURLI|nr:hypothetical protein VFPFJ_04590 [Purpureocillium lilacinum]OAQ90430.1 hypothetical protein VFPFJ_04590 [Purpureocillium lilacinum]
MEDNIGCQKPRLTCGCCCRLYRVRGGSARARTSALLGGIVHACEGIRTRFRHPTTAGATRSPMQQFKIDTCA